jgi:hypothetical protein
MKKRHEGRLGTTVTLFEAPGDEAYVDGFFLSKA